MRKVSCLLFLVCVSLGAATPADTAGLAATVKSMRGWKGMPDADYRRHQSRVIQWIDVRLKGGSTVELMNRELTAAGLIAKDLDFLDELENGQIGSLDPLTILEVRSSKDVFAIACPIHRTAACGVDTTALVYQKTPLHLLAQVNAYADGTYLLQDLDVGESNPAGERLIATGWTGANCTSTWNGKAIRIDRATDSVSRPLLRHDLAAQSQGDKDVDIRLHGNIVDFRYHGATNDMSLVSTPAIARYRVDGDRVVREVPLALTRAGFIYEWTDASREEAAMVSAPEALRRRKDVVGALAMHVFEWVRVSRCGGTPPVWEVAVAVRFSDPERRFVFRIAGARATELRMLAVTSQPDRSCTPIDISKDFTAVSAALPW